jgi:hypothetical protein
MVFIEKLFKGVVDLYIVKRTAEKNNDQPAIKKNSHGDKKFRQR